MRVVKDKHVKWSEKLLSSNKLHSNFQLHLFQLNEIDNDGIRTVTIVADCSVKLVFIFLPSHNKVHENFNAEQKWFVDIKQETHY